MKPLPSQCCPAFDALTFGLTLLGGRSPYSDNPDAMVSAITPEAAAAVARLVELAAGNGVQRQADL